MVLKNIKFILIILLFYQNTLFTKSNSFEKIDSKNLSKYFSGIVAFENKNNPKALDFFESSKILINQHDQYLERFVMSLFSYATIPEKYFDKFFELILLKLLLFE